jgi:hypothetical protein
VLTSKFLGPGSIGGITDTIKKVPINQETKKEPNLKDQSKLSIRKKITSEQFMDPKSLKST